MDKDNLIKVLELTMKEEQFYLGVFQKEVAFFWSTISAIVVASLVGLYKSTEWKHYLFLIIAPLMLIVLTSFIQYSLFRTYQRFVEVITTRAKLEAVLGFDNLIVPDNSKYWTGESILVKRHITDRSTYRTSQGFIDFVSERGLYRIYSQIMTFVKVISLVLIAVLITTSYFLY